MKLNVNHTRSTNAFLFVRSSMLFLTFVITSFNSFGQQGDDPIPYQPFVEISINLTLPDYNSLKTDGGFKRIEGGVKGIILYRKNSTTYIAYERNCSFHPYDDCATVDIDASSLFISDACCTSTFNFDDGNPTGGPAWRPLRQYQTYLDDNTLTVTNEIVP